MVSARIRHALTLALLFFVISSPYTYTLVDRLVSPILGSLIPQLAHIFKIAEGGCPTTYGLLVHSVVFGAVAYALKE
jgi:hypothetical protein